MAVTAKCRDVFLWDVCISCAVLGLFEDLPRLSVTLSASSIDLTFTFGEGSAVLVVVGKDVEEI